MSERDTMPAVSGCRAFRTVGPSLALCVASLAALGCEARVSLGGACGPGIVCPSPLVCGVGGRCRVECTTSAECPVGERCLVDVAVGIAACSIEAERCTTDCAAGLECVAGQCQTRCMDGDECPDGMCSPEGTCVVPPREDAGVGDAPATDDAGSPACRALGEAIIDVDVGTDEVCAVTAGGAVYCWGYFPVAGPRTVPGECWLGEGGCYPRPQRVLDLEPVDRIAVGHSFACAIRRSDGRVHCWGSDFEGTISLTPVTVEASPGVPLVATEIEAGRTHVCALSPAIGGDPAGIRCWGANEHGALGLGTTGDTAEVRAGYATQLVPAGSLVVSEHASFTLSAGVLRGVGTNDDSELGAPCSLHETTAVVRADLGAIAVGAGAEHTCILDAAAHPRCWGRLGNVRGNDDSMLFDCPHAGSPEMNLATHVPSDFSDAPELEGLALAAFGDSALGWTADGVVYGWGSSWGLILDPMNIGAPAVLRALEGRVVHRLEVGYQTACAIEDGGRLLCWGFNGNGETGRGTLTESEPTAAEPCW